MAIAESYSGTETVSTTEWSLTSDSSSLGAITTDGVYQLFLDLSALQDGDTFELKIYEKVLSGGTQRVVMHTTFSNAQTSEPHWVSPALVLMHGWEMSLKRLAGSDRSINWSIRSVT